MALEAAGFDQIEEHAGKDCLIGGRLFPEVKCEERVAILVAEVT